MQVYFWSVCCLLAGFFIITFISTGGISSRVSPRPKTDCRLSLSYRKIRRILACIPAKRSFGRVEIRQRRRPGGSCSSPPINVGCNIKTVHDGKALGTTDRAFDDGCTNSRQAIGVKPYAMSPHRKGAGSWVALFECDVAHRPSQAVVLFVSSRLSQSNRF